MCSISNIRLTVVCSRFEFEARSRLTAVKKEDVCSMNSV